MPHPFPPHFRLRPGSSWSRKAGDDPHALVTITACDPDEEPDELGRRPSDTNVGSVKSAELADSFCDWFNRAQDGYQGSLTDGPTEPDDGAAPRQTDQEAPVVAYTYRPTVKDVSSRPAQVDRELLASLLETSPCQAARESYNGHVSSGEETRALAHPLAAEHACPSCDLARALGVPERFTAEDPDAEPREGDRVVYVGPLTSSAPASEWAARRELPGIVVHVGSGADPDAACVWHPHVGIRSHAYAAYTASLRDLLVVERATYAPVHH